MALIKCPECGKEVSSNTKQCIHCGSKFTACPECGNVAVGEVSVCQKCGYAFKKGTNEIKFKEEVNSTIEGDLLKRWQKSSPVDGTVMKFSKIVKITVGVLSVVFFTVAVIKLVSWLKSDELEKIMTAIKTKSTIKSMIAVVCIFDILDMLCEPIANAYIKLRCGNWIKRNKIDAISYLRANINNADINSLDDYKLMAEAVYYKENAKNKYEIFIGLIVRLLCATALFISGGICIVQNLIEIMSSNLSNRSFEFQYTALIFFGIFAIIYFLAVIGVDALNGKKYNSWLEKNIIGTSDEQ